MNWKSLCFRILVPIISLVVARYCARTAVAAEVNLKSIIPNQKLPDLLPTFGSQYMLQLFERMGKDGLEVYQQYIFYRLPSQVLVISIVYPILRDIAGYLGNCEKKLDLFQTKKTNRFYPSAYMHALSWPFLLFDVLQTVLILLCIRTFKDQVLFSVLADAAGKLANLKNLSLMLLINGIPVSIVISLIKILLIGWKTGSLFRGFRRNDLKLSQAENAKKSH